MWILTVIICSVNIRWVNQGTSWGLDLSESSTTVFKSLLELPQTDTLCTSNSLSQRYVFLSFVMLNCVRTYLHKMLLSESLYGMLNAYQNSLVCPWNPTWGSHRQLHKHSKTFMFCFCLSRWLNQCICQLKRLMIKHK